MKKDYAPRVLTDESGTSVTFRKNALLYGGYVCKDSLQFKEELALLMKDAHKQYLNK